MTEADDDRMEQHYHYFHNYHDHNHTPRPLGGAEAYHRFLWHNKHVLFELKLSVIVIVGGIIMLACVVYIVLQCRARSRSPPNQTKNRRDDEKELIGSTETLENLIPAENSIRLKVRKGEEFFV